MRKDDAINEEDYLFNRMLELISKKSYTQSEIKKKLSAKTQDAQLIERIINKLKEYKYLDDENFARKYLAEREKYRSLREIEFKLTMKGVPKQIIYRVMADVEKSDEACRNMASKYMRGKLINKDSLQKLYAYLFGKGFESDEISHIVREYRNEIKEDIGDD